MTARPLRIGAYDFASAAPVGLDPAGAYFAYASEGALILTEDGREETIAQGDGRFLPQNALLRGNGWLFGVSRVTAPPLPSPAAAIELTAEVVVDTAGPAILRTDAVTAPPGAQTPRHGHRGPGVRRLLTGLLLAEVGPRAKRIRAGDAWFEAVEDWVVGTNINSADNTFIRLMVLPASLKGGHSSFVPASPEEAAKTRAVHYRLFGEIDFS